jgi:hypothetical protein
VEVLELVGCVVVGMLGVEEMDELDEVLAGLDVEVGAELDVLERTEVERVVELDDEVDTELVEELEEGRLDVEEVVELDGELERLERLELEELVELDEVLGRLELEEDEGALVEIELLDEKLDEEEAVLKTEPLELETDTAVKLYIVNRDEPPHCLNY